MWWPLPSILSGKFGLSFSPFLKRINQENKNKEKRAVNAKRVILDWGLPARGQPAPPTLVPSPSRPQDPDLGPL